MYRKPNLYIIVILLLFCATPKVASQFVELDSIFLSRLPKRFPQIKSLRMMHPAQKPDLYNILTKTQPPTYLIPITDGVSFWKKNNNLAVQINESTFSNWNAGGNNSVAALAVLQFQRKYLFRFIQWENTLSMRYGVNVQENEKYKKTDDELRFVSTLGYRQDTISNWYYSVKLNFRTQFTHGYKYPNREKIISSIMAPGYLFLGAGTAYSLDKKAFNFYFSPVTLKSTFVLRQELADAGAFGVQKAVYDEAGNRIQKGRNMDAEFGILVTNTWKKELFKNIQLNHRINLYSDYLERFGNVDIDWELQLQFLINKYFKANLGAHLIYDDDVRFEVVKNAQGTITDNGFAIAQFKQNLGIGLSYDF
ncbi:MAG: DUF3078 domain-containing protein [Flavobacteriaceae bacterium]|nr:DUF3078 domain-containing protein [Flavobacteriaceae bacterium]